MTTAEVQTKPPKRRRGFRVSLRVFMLLILVLGVLMAWKTNKARRIRRALAEVQRLGGTAWYDYQLFAPGDRNAAPRPEPRWIQRLLGPEYFHDVHLVFLHCPYVAGDPPARIRDLGFLSDLSDLRILEISNSGVDDAAFRRMLPLPRLQVLSLYESRVSDAGLAWISGCRELQMLTVSSKLCGDETARRVGRLSTIQELQLYAGRMTDEGVEAISPLNALTKLDITGKNLGDRSLVVATSFANLTELDMGGLTHATNDGLKRIAVLTKLTRLTLRGPSLSDWDMASLSGLATLSSLNLADARFGRKAFSAYSAPPALLDFRVFQASIADGSLDPIAKAPGLRSFNIVGSDISDKAIRHLRMRWPALRVWARTNGPPSIMFSEIDILDLL